MKVLVVEDDTSISEPLVAGLRREGFEVTHVATGAAALDADEADIVLLDLGLPDLDGQVVCRRLRERTDVPILVVTARGEEIDRVTLLELGADDYVVKPFGFRELVARIRAITRRTSVRATAPETTTIGPLSIDRRRRRVEVSADEVVLAPKEYDLLVFLADDAGAVRGREQILAAVWDEHWWGSTKTLDVHIASVRKKLGRPELIETIRGVGFRLLGPDEVAE